MSVQPYQPQPNQPDQLLPVQQPPLVYNNQVQTVYVQSGPPRASRFAHGFWWWLLLGWWWVTLKWTCRVLLWIFLLPVGIWVSVMHHDNKKQARIRRGYNK